MRKTARTAAWPAGTLLHPQPADHDFSLVIPAFNEENRLPWTLAELRRFLDAWDIDYRVLVADDGSTDRTATLAAGWARDSRPSRCRKIAAKARPCETPCSAPPARS